MAQPPAPGRKVFPKHPLSYDTPDDQRRIARAMLAHHGRACGRVWVIEQDCICYVNPQSDAFCARIERDPEDKGWVLGEVTAGWPVLNPTTGAA